MYHRQRVERTDQQKQRMQRPINNNQPSLEQLNKLNNNLFSLSSNAYLNRVVTKLDQRQ